MTADISAPESDAGSSATASAPMMSAAQLAAALNSARPPIVLDVRWALGGSDRDAFARGHTPGALFLDLDAALAAPAGSGGRHPLPSPAFVHEWMRAVGIAGDTPVVVTGQRDTSMAARAWWILRWAGHSAVRVLDGGFEAWHRAGLPIADGFDPGRDEVTVPGGGEGNDVIPAVAPVGGVAAADRSGGAPAATPAEIATGQMPTVDVDAVAAVPESDAVLLDARAPERYRGEIEPVDPVPGHIPGAQNVPLAAIHDADGLLLSAPTLRTIFADAGVRSGQAAIASCGSGVTACSLILAAEVAGLSLALYPGSYSGWCALKRPVVAGG